MVPKSTALPSVGHTVHLTVDCLGSVLGTTGGSPVSISGVGPTGGTTVGPTVGHVV